MTIRMTSSISGIELENMVKELKNENAVILDDIRLEMQGYLPDDGTPFRVLEVKSVKKARTNKALPLTDKP